METKKYVIFCRVVESAKEGIFFWIKFPRQHLFLLIHIFLAVYLKKLTLLLTHCPFY